VYVRPFPGDGRRERLSTNGGAQVRWRRDGKELFYIATDGRLIVVPLHLAPDGRTLTAGPPTALFMTRIGAAIQPTGRHQYIADSDGRRFLMSTLIEDTSTAPITLILNWKPKE
jgi:hypothetical protein